MKSPVYFFAFLPFLLLSCSAYKEVSLSNFENYKVTSNIKEDIHYVLKTYKLIYSDIDRIHNIHHYEINESTPFESHSVIFEDNIVIPTGASGVCIHSQDDNFIIDFGKGVLVPFSIMNDDNKAKGKIVIDGRTYSLVDSHRKASLFFDSRSLTSSGSRHSARKENKTTLPKL
jgi:hypothetical protein